MARGYLSEAGAQAISPFDLGLLILKVYVRYPLAPASTATVPYNYCALPRLFPAVAPLVNLFCQ